MSAYTQEAPARSARAVSNALTELIPDHATLSVDDMDKECAWYQRVLGFKETNRLERPKYTVRQLRSAHARIDFIHYPGSVRTPGSPAYVHQGWVHIAFNVPDLSAALAALKSLNADVTPNGDDGKGGPTFLLLRDPEGNEIEIFGSGVPH